MTLKCERCHCRLPGELDHGPPCQCPSGERRVSTHTGTMGEAITDGVFVPSPAEAAPKKQKKLRVPKRGEIVEALAMGIAQACEDTLDLDPPIGSYTEDTITTGRADKLPATFRVQIEGQPDITIMMTEMQVPRTDIVRLTIAERELLLRRLEGVDDPLRATLVEKLWLREGR